MPVGCAEPGCWAGWHSTHSLPAPKFSPDIQQPAPPSPALVLSCVLELSATTQAQLSKINGSISMRLRGSRIAFALWMTAVTALDLSVHVSPGWGRKCSASWNYTRMWLLYIKDNPKFTLHLVCNDHLVHSPILHTNLVAEFSSWLQTAEKEIATQSQTPTSLAGL